MKIHCRYKGKISLASRNSIVTCALPLAKASLYPNLVDVGVSVKEQSLPYFYKYRPEKLKYNQLQSTSQRSRRHRNSRRKSSRLCQCDGNCRPSTTISTITKADHLKIQSCFTIGWNNSKWSKFSVARAFRQTVVRNYNRAKAMCSNMMYMCETIIYNCHWKKNPVSVVPSIVKRICGHLKSAGYSDALHVGFNSRTHSTFFILSIVNCKW